MKWLLDLLREPDAYRGEPGAYAVNQIGHVVLIGALPVWLGVPPIVVLVLFAFWELVQWNRFGAELWDCFEDAAFVAAGVAAVFWPWVLGPVGLFLLSGTLRRVAEK